MASCCRPSFSVSSRSLAFAEQILLQRFDPNTLHADAAHWQRRLEHSYAIGMLVGDIGVKVRALIRQVRLAA